MRHADTINNDSLNSSLRIKPKVPDTQGYILIVEKSLLDKRIHGVICGKADAFAGIRIAESGKVSLLAVIHTNYVKSLLVLEQDLGDFAAYPGEVWYSNRLWSDYFFWGNHFNLLIFLLIKNKSNGLLACKAHRG
jgi:hypothetical protein